MPFTFRQCELLCNNCYGVPDLPELLERMRLEGPGDYNWPPAPGYYAPEETPLFERVFAQIWHQGDLYPATYVAVPVWCEMVVLFPDISHARLLGLMSLIETTRPFSQQRLLSTGALVEEDVSTYERALQDVVETLPTQMMMLDDSTPEGFRAIEGIMALLAFAQGHRWLGTLLVRHGLPLNPSAVEDTAGYVLNETLVNSLRQQGKTVRQNLESLRLNDREFEF